MRVNTAWPRAKRHYQLAPSPEWMALLRETEAIIDDDPASERAQALALRWRDLWRVEVGSDPAMREGMMKAWVDRERWPQSLRSRMTELNLERVLRFLAEAGWEMAARQFRDRLSQQSTLGGLGDCFPFPVLSLEAPVRAFHDYYGT